MGNMNVSEKSNNKASEIETIACFYELSADHAEKKVTIFRFLAIIFFGVAVNAFTTIVHAIRLLIVFAEEYENWYINTAVESLRNQFAVLLKTSITWLLVSVVLMIVFSIVVHVDKKKSKEYRQLANEVRSKQH